MSLPHILLGLVKYRPNTGYNIKTAFQNSINFFWDVSLPQIYRTLNSMEKKGWLESAIELQEGKPNKKRYRITEKGDQQFRHWLEQEPVEIRAKDELLVKLFFGNFMDRDVLISHLKERRENAEKFLGKAQSSLEPSVHDYAKNADAEDDEALWLLTLDFGRRKAQMTMEWCDHALKILEKQDL